MPSDSYVCHFAHRAHCHLLEIVHLSIFPLTGRPILSSSDLREPPSGIVNTFMDPNFPDGQMNNVGRETNNSAVAPPPPALPATRNGNNNMMMPPSYAMTSAATREILLRAACKLFYNLFVYLSCLFVCLFVCLFLACLFVLLFVSVYVR